MTKIISLLLAVLSSLSSITAASSGNVVKSVNDNGYPAITTEQFYYVDNLLGSVNPVFDISIDDMTKEICSKINDNSALDIEMLVTNLPDLNVGPRVVTKLLNIDTVAFRKAAYSYRDKLNSEGKGSEAFLVYLFGAYLSAFKSCDINLVPKGNEYEFMLHVVFEDGTNEDIYTGIFYNQKTGDFHGNSDSGMADIGYNFDINDMVVYATLNCWMRDYGFCVGYDMISYALPLFSYETRRFQFNYNDREWMIQIWKGNYVITNGSEVGVYTRDKGSLGTYYNCASDDEMLNMSMQLYHGDELIIDVKEQPHWWANGFKLADTLYTPSSMTLKFTVEMKDNDMLKAFCKSIDRDIHQDLKYTVEGLKVFCEW